MLQMIYDFFVTFFALDGVTPATAAMLELVIFTASIAFACVLIGVVFNLVKALVLWVFRVGQ